MTPTSPTSYNFLDESTNLNSNLIRSTPITNKNNTHTDIPTNGSAQHNDGPTSPLPQPNITTDITTPTISPMQQPQPTHPDPNPNVGPIQMLAQDQHPLHTGPTIIAPDIDPNSVLVHPMVTRFRIGSNRPPECLNLHVSSISPLPKSYVDAFNDPNWQNAMNDEYDALIKK
ncbi:ribonuclease H-like domain-containing protein [Tanacetum coccineum]